MIIAHLHDKQVIGNGPDAVAAGEGGEASGIAVYLRRLVAAQAARGDRVHTARFTPGVAAEDDSPDHATFPSSATRKDTALNRRILVWLERCRPDIVHLHSVYYALHPSLITEIAARFPTVCTIHDVTPICYRRDRLHRGSTPCERSVGVSCVLSGCFLPGSTVPPAEWAKRLIHHHGTAPAHRALPQIITPSDMLRDLLVGSGYDHAAIKPIPLFTRFEREAAEQHQAPDRSPAHIVSIGRVAAEKGQRTLAEALARIPADTPWTATIAGDGPDLPTVRDLVESLGLTERIQLPGHVDPAAAEQLYRAADIVVMPSLIPESFGLVGVEAMSFARPVVGFPSGGIREWLADRTTGRLAAHADTDDLARILAELIKDPAQRTRLGAAGQARVREKYVIGAHLCALDDIYNQAAPCPKTARAS